MYLGLLVAGASPALGSAAMARNFDLRDEVEFADDLENKPDDERSPVSASVRIYLEDLDHFFAYLGWLRDRGHFDAQLDTFEVAQSTTLPCLDSDRAGSYVPMIFRSSREQLRPALDSFSRGMQYGYSLGDCVGGSEFSGTPAVESRFEFKLDEGSFSARVSVRKTSAERASALLRELESTIRLFSAKTGEPRSRSIIQYTSFSIFNDRVIISTHLPRGSLPALVSADAV